MNLGNPQNMLSAIIAIPQKIQHGKANTESTSTWHILKGISEQNKKRRNENLHSPNKSTILSLKLLDTTDNFFL